MLRSLILTALFSLSAVSIASAASTVLTYDVQAQGDSVDSAVNIDKVFEAVKNRLTAASVEHAVVSSHGDHQIVVELSDSDATLADKAKQALSQPGNLEFRIVADKQIDEHVVLIKIALAQPANKREREVRDADKELRGKFVKLGPPPQCADSAVRRKNKEGRDEVLVVIDDFNVTGQYLKSVSAAISNEGDAVGFSFDEKGAQKFGELTERNLPDPVSGKGHELAVIVDDQLFSAAVIRSKIGSSGQITNPKFTQAEIKNLVAILKSGPLPAKLKLVSETTAKAP